MHHRLQPKKVKVRKAGLSIYSTARFKLYAREYILASINTFSPSSQPMLASKGNVLSCMILLARVIAKSGLMALWPYGLRFFLLLLLITQRHYSHPGSTGSM